MPFDGIVLAAVARQLSDALTGAKIDKIYQPEQEEIILHMNTRGGKLRLFISANSANPRIHLAPDYGTNPQTPKGFCMLLRKHIQGGRLSSVAQKGSERIIEFGIDAVNELGFSQGKRLIVEIMGKHSNIILMDSASGKIIDSIKRLSPDMNRYRQTLPGSPYIEPPSHGKLSWYDATAEDIAALTASCDSGYDEDGWDDDGDDDDGDGGNCHASGSESGGRDDGDGGNCHASGSEGRDDGDGGNCHASGSESGGRDDGDGCDDGDGGNCHASESESGGDGWDSGAGSDGGDRRGNEGRRGNGDEANYNADAAGTGESYDPAALRAFSECVSRSLLGGIQGIGPRAADELAAGIAARVFGSEMGGIGGWANCHAGAAGADRSGVGTGVSAVEGDANCYADTAGADKSGDGTDVSAVEGDGDRHTDAANNDGSGDRVSRSAVEGDGNRHAGAAGADRSGGGASRSAVREESGNGVDGGRAGIGRDGVDGGRAGIGRDGGDGGRAGIGRVGMAAWGAISGMVSAIQAGRFAPCVYLDENGVPADFHAFPLAAFEGAYRAERFGDISSAVEFYYSNKDSSNRMRQKTSDLIKTVNAGINKLQLKKQRLLEDLVKAENADQDRLLGELLTASLHNIKPGQKTAEITNYYDGSTVAIELDPRLSPAQNAQRFYKRYAKAKTAIVEKNNQLAETGRELMYLESVLAFLENASAYEEAEAIRQELIDEGYLRRRKAPASKKPPKPAFLSYQVSGGLQALAGRNNRENDILTFKRASSGDIWFHTKDIPGTHVILLTSGADAPAEAIAEAASIAAWHSRARESENVPVDYTFVKYVKKPSGAKPGMVIFTNNRTIYAKPALPPERM